MKTNGSPGRNRRIQLPSSRTTRVSWETTRIPETLYGMCKVREASQDIKKLVSNKYKFVCEISQHVLYHNMFLRFLWFYDSTRFGTRGYDSTRFGTCGYDSTWFGTCGYNSTRFGTRGYDTTRFGTCVYDFQDSVLADTILQDSVLVVTILQDSVLVVTILQDSYRLLSGPKLWRGGGVMSDFLIFYLFPRKQLGGGWIHFENYRHNTTYKKCFWPFLDPSPHP